MRRGAGKIAIACPIDQTVHIIDRHDRNPKGFEVGTIAPLISLGAVDLQTLGGRCVRVKVRPGSPG